MSQQQLKDIVISIVRDTGRPATSVAIGTRLYVSDRHARRWLSQLEGVAVQRVGQRRGWLPITG